MYGGEWNSASVIGKYGNPYADYIAAFGLPLPNDGLNLIPVTGIEAIAAPMSSGISPTVPGSLATSVPVICDISKSRKLETRHNPKSQDRSELPTTPSPSSRSHVQRRSTITKLIENGYSDRGQVPTSKSQQPNAEEESFMDVLRTVASALPSGSGIIGGPIGTLAGFALNTASTAMTETGAESVMDGQAMHEGSMERAILAEATLRALQSTELPADMEESIFSDMKDAVMKALPVIRKAAPHVMGAMMEPALKIALDLLHNYNQKAAGGAESFESPSTEPFRPNVLYTAAIDRPADRHVEWFLGYLGQSLKQSLQESAMNGDSEEGFIDIIKAGARITGKGVLAAANLGLPIIANAVKESGGAEAYEEQHSSDSAAPMIAADPLAQRALVADAALTAVMKMPPQQLQEECFFDIIGDAIKHIAPVVMSVAPVVAKAIRPTLGKVVPSVLKQAPASVDESTVLGSTGSRRAAGARDVSVKRSLRSLRDASAHGNGGRSRIDLAGANRSQDGGMPSRFLDQWNY